MFLGCLAKICEKHYYKLKRQEVEATRESFIMGRVVICIYHVC